ncbi:MAG: DUF6165 family protein [Cucumibacter sp.]
MATQGTIRVEIAPGELLDKIVILEIKAARIADADKLAHVQAELTHLIAARDAAIPPFDGLLPLVRELKSVNEALWDIEDAIRAEEAAARFGPRFIALARAVYRTNDRRAAIKRRINEVLGSALVEEKSYAAEATGEEAPEPAAGIEVELAAVRTIGG